MVPRRLLFRTKLKRNGNASLLRRKRERAIPRLRPQSQSAQIQEEVTTASLTTVSQAIGAKYSKRVFAVNTGRHWSVAWAGKVFIRLLSALAGKTWENLGTDYGFCLVAAFRLCSCEYFAQGGLRDGRGISRRWQVGQGSGLNYLWHPPCVSVHRPPQPENLSSIRSCFRLWS